MGTSTHDDTLSFWPILVFKCGSELKDHASYIKLWPFGQSIVHCDSQKNSLTEPLKWVSNWAQCFAFSTMLHGFCVIVSISIRNFTYFCLNRMVSHRFASMSVTVRNYESCCAASVLLHWHTQLKEFRKWILLIVRTQHYCTWAPLSRMMQQIRSPIRYIQSSLRRRPQRICNLSAAKGAIPDSPDSIAALHFTANHSHSVPHSIARSLPTRRIFAISFVFAWHLYVQCRS